jgi:hypothetical protein
MSNRYDPGPVLSGLRDFQLATVNHVFRRFYEDPDVTRRFLVADPVGMGKTYVARGVIARAIAHLEDVDAVGRIDIVYVCSNADIAAQNVSRLDVTNGRGRFSARRLTLLATSVEDLDRPSDEPGKTVNLVAFTPGTAFDLAGRGGIAEERALLHLLLAGHYGLDRPARSASKRVLQGGVQTLESFERTISFVESKLGSASPQVVESFLKQLDQGAAGFAYLQFLDDVRGRQLTRQQKSGAHDLVGSLRDELARASIDALEPDLVILDEFQRFKHLLDPGRPAGDLAHRLFEYRDARVLLLSATPYKMYTLAEETALGEDHHQDFLDTVEFLGADNGVTAAEVAGDLADLRTSLIRGQSARNAARRLSDRLRLVMCRTERPDLGEYRLLREYRTPADDVQADDFLAYANLRRIADAVDAPMSVEYWKSAPYFLNFIDGYQMGAKVREALAEPGPAGELEPLMNTGGSLDRDKLRTYQPVDLGNAKLRALAAGTTAAGWWQLLWLPPSLPYHRAAGPWADTSLAGGFTKRLIFSSWAATPTSIAGLLSYEAERQTTGPGAETSTQQARRLDFRISEGRPAAMTALALFWPYPGLASRCDPLAIARATPGVAPTLEQALHLARAEVEDLVGGDGSSRPGGSEVWYWSAAGRRDTELKEVLGRLDPAQVAEALAGVTDEQDESDRPDRAGLNMHVRMALDQFSVAREPSDRPTDLTETLALLGLASPGNVAWRALRRHTAASQNVSEAGLWKAAAVLASGFRTLFNRPDSIRVIDYVLPDETYWRNVLTYCAMGNLQAVMDEYLHHLAEDERFRPLDDDKLLALAQAARSAIALRPGTYRAYDPRHPYDPGIPLLSRFALRYGTARQRDDDARLPELRQAFNSPFRPFVLATTSIGQEGVDFHWWCHAVVHWNVPPNPVDFEQREGRVTRYKGHAIRRNIAHKHRYEALSSDRPDPWQSLFDAAAATRPPGVDDQYPYWVYRGPAAIERHLLQLPLSRDQRRYELVRDALTVYRLAFGQPRQEDLVTLLQHYGVDAEVRKDSLVDLRPE